MAGTARRRESARAVGLRVEARVVRYLQRHGLKRIANNVSSRRGEIDLVMLDGRALVFVEVRYRGRRSRVKASLTVDTHKQQRIVAAAGWFLSKHPEYYDFPCRFDVVGVDKTLAGTLHVDWLRDAFRES